MVFLKSPDSLTQPVNHFKGYRLHDKPTGLTFNSCTLCAHCIYLKTDSDLCRLRHKLIEF
jgi:hypothetical protein